MTMKKITPKIWIYATNFLIEAIMFNVALAFAIVAIIFKDQGMTIWAIIAISSTAIWITQMIFKHIIWMTMKPIEKALYLAIRKHGKKVIEISSSEIRNFGQSDIQEVLLDVDSGLEIQMTINGFATFINTYIGIRWFIHGIQFHKNHSSFEYVNQER